MEEKNKSIGKILSSILVIAVIVIILGYNRYTIYQAEQKLAIEAAQEQVQLEEVKAAMTQDEMEEAIAEHKIDATKQDITTGKDSGTADGGTNEDGSIKDAEQLDESNTDLATQSVIDFEGLWELNQDVYAWISVPGTEIEYPILQHSSDDTYYLNYNIDGSYGYPGCIYTESLNSKEFTDPNTVIYGHNMKNGTMFAGLHDFRDSDFFEENQEIIIYTPDEVLQYQIFAAYIYDNRHIMYSFDFTNEDIYATYLTDIFDRRDMNSNINENIEVTTEDKIITLATCIADQPDNRLLVQAVLESQ